MKKLFFLAAFMGLFALTAGAQTKTCCSSKTDGKTETTAADKASCSSAADAEKAASADASIFKQTSNKGEVSYARKDVCTTSGKVKFVPVEYCSKSAAFVDPSPADATKTCCTKDGATKGD